MLQCITTFHSLSHLVCVGHEAHGLKKERISLIYFTCKVMQELIHFLALIHVHMHDHIWALMITFSSTRGESIRVTKESRITTTHKSSYIRRPSDGRAASSLTLMMKNSRLTKLISSGSFRGWISHVFVLNPLPFKISFLEYFMHIFKPHSEF